MTTEDLFLEIQQNMQDRHSVSHVFANQNRWRGDLQAAVADLANPAEALEELEKKRTSGQREKVSKELQQMWKVLVPVPVVLTIASGTFEVVTWKVESFIGFP